MVPLIDAGDDTTSTHRLNKEDEGRNREDIVVGREGGEPVDGKVMDPDN